jgi:membrane protease YdiL (CAAX protease family)
LLAGSSAIAALAGLWIVMFRLGWIGVNPLLPSSFTSSPALTIAITIGASLLAPITEESAFRGYLQGSLERDFSASTAVVLSSIVFAIAHVTQGLSAPKLFFYFLVGVVFGVLAYLNESILPVIPVHIAADLTFFLCVWPYDSARPVVWNSDTDIWFWVHVIQVAIFAVLFILALRTVDRVQAEDRPRIRRDKCDYSG